MKMGWAGVLAVSLAAGPLQAQEQPAPTVDAPATPVQTAPAPSAGLPPLGVQRIGRPETRSADPQDETDDAASMADAKTGAPADAFRRDALTVGIGALIAPRFEGASASAVVPGAVARGRFHGVGFTVPGNALYLDVVPPTQPTGIKAVFGPVVHVETNRSSLRRVRDPQIVALGRVPLAADVGVHLGAQQTGVYTSDYDVFAIDVSVTHDVTQVHGSTIVVPSISYGTPLSRKAFAGLSVSGTHVGSGYAQRYFGVDARQSLASGLPSYRPGAGFKDVTLTGLFNLSLTGDLLGGLSLFGTASYERLLGDFARSPIVRDRNQVYGGVGIAYTF